MKLILPDLVLSRGQTYQIPVRSADLYSILGFQFSWVLKEEVIESMQLHSGESPLNRENYARRGQFLTFSWFVVDGGVMGSDAPVFYVELEVSVSVYFVGVLC